MAAFLGTMNAAPHAPSFVGCIPVLDLIARGWDRHSVPFPAASLRDVLGTPEQVFAAMCGKCEAGEPSHGRTAYCDRGR
jgi:hypothetical protein